MSEHQELFEQFALTPEMPPPYCYTNWLGIHTDARLFGNYDDLVGKVIRELPLGSQGDNVYGGRFEYASLLAAVVRAKPSSSISVVELGAGWGPWISAAGIAARRAGIAEVKLVGIEADGDRYRLMEEHMARNGLSGGRGVTTRLILGAAWKENTKLKFGALSGGDHGGAVKTGEGEADYRGFSPTFVEVAAYDLATICDGLDVVDYMHWDIQGAELEVATASIQMMNQRVRSIFIGTHSPMIEGCLLDLLFKNGWDVTTFHTCGFTFDRSKPSLEAMCNSDGVIAAINPRLVGDDYSSR